MREEDKKKLTDNRPKLVECIDLTRSSLYTHLRSARLITQEQENSIRSNTSNVRQVEILLDVIAQKDENAFTRFCEALECSGQPYIVKEILKGPSQRSVHPLQTCQVDPSSNITIESVARECVSLNNVEYTNHRLEGNLGLGKILTFTKASKIQADDTSSDKMGTDTGSFMWSPIGDGRTLVFVFARFLQILLFPNLQGPGQMDEWIMEQRDENDVIVKTFRFDRHFYPHNGFTTQMLAAPSGGSFSGRAGHHGICATGRGLWFAGEGITTLIRHKNGNVMAKYPN